MGFEDSWRWARGKYREQTQNNFRSYMIRFKSSALYKSFDKMFIYKEIFENLGKG